MRARHAQAREAIEHRRRKVAELAIARATYAEIATACGVSRATVHRDLLALRKEWRQARLRDTNEVVGEELHKLMLAERAILPSSFLATSTRSTGCSRSCDGALACSASTLPRATWSVL